MNKRAGEEREEFEGGGSLGGGGGQEVGALELCLLQVANNDIF